jgi:hypothetical protein
MTKSRKVSLPIQTPPGSVWLTRAKVAEALGCSIPTVRRMEGTALQPTQDEDGVHRFDPVEVIQLLSDRSARIPDASKEGERDARVFEMLNAGKGLREIVTMLRVPVDIASKLSDVWRDAGRRDLVVPPACRAELDQCLGGVGDAFELTQMVRGLEAERERLESENEKTSNRICGILVFLAELATTNSTVESALHDLRSELDADQCEMLDRCVGHHRQRPASNNQSRG